MDVFTNFIQNKYIYIPFLLWALIQSYKVIYDLTSLATLIGKNEGVDSPIFAVSLFLALIVMYDACGVRRAAGKQAAILNKIVQTPGLTSVQVSEKLVELLGHTPIQVFVGALIGIIAGIVA